MAMALFSLWFLTDLQGMHAFYLSSAQGTPTSLRHVRICCSRWASALSIVGRRLRGPGPFDPIIARPAITSFFRSRGLRVLDPTAGSVISVRLASFLISALGTPENPAGCETFSSGVCLTIGFSAVPFPSAAGTSRLLLSSRLPSAMRAYG